MTTWTKAAPGVWRTQVGGVDALRPLDFSASPPRLDALADIGEAAFPFADGAVAIEPVDGHVVLRFPLKPDEQLYGPGLQFKAINQRHKVFHLKVDHYGGADNGRTHAPCPFYVSSHGYAVLVNTARFVSFYMGSAVRKDSPNPPIARDRNTDKGWTATPLSDAVEAAVPGDNVEVFVFSGASPLAAVRRFILYSGGGCLPPRWGLGFWHRTPLPYAAQQVVDEAEEFLRRGFPLQVIGLEPGWQSCSYPCSYAWDQTRFPDPAGFCHRLLEKGIRVNLWENPYVSPESPLYEKLLPLSGSHTVWCGLVPDTTLPEAIKAMQDFKGREQVDIGVSGYKTDECDGFDGWLWPDHATFPSGTSGEVMRQTYALQGQKLVTAMFRRRNRRTYGLTRASNAGGAGYPFALYNDCYDFAEFLAGLCNSGFCGVLWTPELRSARSPEEWVRRMQLVCLSPVAMLNAWADCTTPWSFPEVEEIVKETMRFRIRLTPYLYSAFAQYCFAGIPPFRAMALDYPVAHDQAAGAGGTLDATANPYAVAAGQDIKDQFMMGDCLLAAPILPGQVTRRVALPPGTWCDFHTGETIAGGQLIDVSPPLDRIPLYVRDGGIVPLAAEGDPATVEIRHYGHADGHFRLYDDDGETFDFERGCHAWIELRAERGTDNTLHGQERRADGQSPFIYKSFRWKFMTRE